MPGVSYGVDTGETLALIGESASGKSLMVLGAFDLLPPGARATGGATTFAGESLSAGEEATESWSRAIATGVGFLFQDPIAAWTPIIEIGAQAGEVLDDHSDLRPDEITERVMDALGEVHLPRSKRLFRAFSSQLSRGMGQRAMLAAALVKAPRLLIADEPFTGLDVSVAAAILDLIKDLKERRDMAMVLVTHDLGVVARIADRVGVVYGGRIVEEGPVDDVYRRPLHPYTSGLIGSVPTFTTGRLRPIPGEQPPLTEIPPGMCVFADRCPYAGDVCFATEPVLRTIDRTSVACHRAADLDLPGIT